MTFTSKGERKQLKLNIPSKPRSVCERLLQPVSRSRQSQRLKQSSIISCSSVLRHTLLFWSTGTSCVCVCGCCWALKLVNTGIMLFTSAVVGRRSRQASFRRKCAKLCSWTHTSWTHPRLQANRDANGTQTEQHVYQREPNRFEVTLYNLRTISLKIDYIQNENRHTLLLQQPKEITTKRIWLCPSTSWMSWNLIHEISAENNETWLFWGKILNPRLL